MTSGRGEAMQAGNRGRGKAISIEERMNEMVPVLSSLPKGTHVACVDEDGRLYLYNVTKALELFAGRPATASIDVAERAKLIQPRNSGTDTEDKALIDPDHAFHVDLSYPVLVLGSRKEMGGAQGRVIDGWHRIYRASQLGVSQLPAIVLSAEDEALISIDPGSAVG